MKRLVAKRGREREEREEKEKERGGKGMKWRMEAFWLSYSYKSITGPVP